MAPARQLFAALVTIAAFTIVVRWQQLHALGGIALIALAVVATIRRRHALLDLGWRIRRPRPELAVAILGTAVVTLGLLLVFVPLEGRNIGDVLDQIASYSASERLGFLVIGIQAALVEETLFRGWLQSSLVELRGYAAGLVVTALVFGLSHLTLDPVRLSALTFIGLVYGVLRGRTRSLLAPAVAHVLTWVVWGTT
jgi:membrane protease YdiL (CAAX protease family)